MSVEIIKKEETRTVERQVIRLTNGPNLVIVNAPKKGRDGKPLRGTVKVNLIKGEKNGSKGANIFMKRMPKGADLREGGALAMEYLDDGTDVTVIVETRHRTAIQLDSDQIPKGKGRLAVIGKLTSEIAHAVGKGEIGVSGSTQRWLMSPGGKFTPIRGEEEQKKIDDATAKLNETMNRITIRKYGTASRTRLAGDVSPFALDIDAR